MEMGGHIRAFALSRPICGKYALFYVSYAVYLTTRQPARTPFAEWWLYPAVAGHYHTCIFNVKRSVCVAVDRVWETEREALRSITKYPLKREPLPSEFIAILAAYIKRGGCSVNPCAVPCA